MSNAPLDLSILDRVRQRLANHTHQPLSSDPESESEPDIENDSISTQTQPGITYAKTQHIPIENTQKIEVENPSENENDDEIDLQPSQFDFGQSMLFNQLVTQAAVVPELESQDLVEPTQKITTAEDTGFGFDFNSSTLFSNIITQAQKVPSFGAEIGSQGSDKENVTPTSEPYTQIVPSPVPQTLEASTQIIARESSETESPLFSQFVDSNSTETLDLENKKLTASERLARITQLAQQKRQQREQKEQEENRIKAEEALRREELEADITRTSLTDEENDYLDDIRSSDRVVDSSTQNMGKYGRDVKRVQELINIAKRDQVIVPQFVKRKEFSKQDLLKAFESDDEDSEVLSKNQAVDVSSSPLGLARSTQQQSPLTSPISAVSKPRNPMESYAMSLRKTLAPGKEKSEEMMVNLDDDGSSDEFDETSRGKSKNDTEDGFIPALSKEQQLSIKQKFIRRKQRGTTMVNLPKQMRSNMISTAKQHKGHSDLLHTLTRENIQQLVSLKKDNPDQQILEDMEKDDEIMGSLLEREIERVNRVRKREKLREKAAQALLNGESNNNTNNEESDEDLESVPDSDFEDVPDSDFSQDEAEDEVGLNLDLESEQKSSQGLDAEIDRAIDEVGGDDSYAEVTDSKAPTRVDDSYMFGAKKAGRSIIHDGMMVTSISTPVMAEDYDDEDDDEASPLVTVGKRSSPVADDDVAPDSSFGGNFSIVSDGDLFKNLTKSSGAKDHSFTQEMGESHQGLDLMDVLEPRPDLGNTQADDTQTQMHTQIQTQIQTQADGNGNEDTQVIRQLTQTQIIGKSSSTVKSALSPFAEEEEEEEEDDDDDINPQKVAEGRKKIRRNQIEDSEDEVDGEAETETETEQTEEERVQKEAQMKAMQKEYEDRLRRKELKSRKQRKELERRGLKKLVDGEAEESEDEWQGLGGVDGDFSDDQINSEDEKMIDNNFQLDLNDDAVKKKFMEQFKIKDTKELEKLLDDIKNHRLAKRGVGNGFDIELSDEEDELLMRYRQQKMKQQNEKLMANKKIRELAQQQKSRAFFESMKEDDVNVEIEEKSDTEKDQANTEQDEANDDGNDDDLETSLDSKHRRKTLKIEESFVVKQLSFLSSSREDEYERIQRLSRLQHGFESDDDDAADDLQSLKTKCLARLKSGSNSSHESLATRKRVYDEIETDEDENQDNQNDNDDDDDDDDVMPVFKKPSIIQSFKSFQEKQGVQIKNGKQTFSGVTVNKHYKVATGSRAAITYLSKKMVTKESQIKNTIRLNRGSGASFFSEGQFE